MLHTNYKQIIIGAYAYARTFQIRKKNESQQKIGSTQIVHQTNWETYIQKKVRTTKITMKYATFSVLD